MIKGSVQQEDTTVVSTHIYICTQYKNKEIHKAVNQHKGK